MQSVHTLITTQVICVKRAGRHERLALWLRRFQAMFQVYD
jgi:hypothetical protein